MRPVPWWTVLSASAAPLLLLGGCTIAPGRQPGGFDSVTETISTLAARGATDRWLMTAALAGLGLCHLVTALGLRTAALPGRVVLGGGGAATVLVAVFPQPVNGTSVSHMLSAGAAFGALAVWPAGAWRRGAMVRWPLRRAGSVAAAVVLFGLVVWFVFELNVGHRAGLAERVVAGAQSLWPLTVVAAARLSPVALRIRSRDDVAAGAA